MILKLKKYLDEKAEKWSEISLINNKFLNKINYYFYILYILFFSLFGIISTLVIYDDIRDKIMFLIVLPGPILMMVGVYVIFTNILVLSFSFLTGQKLNLKTPKRDVSTRIIPDPLFKNKWHFLFYLALVLYTCYWFFFRFR